MSFEFNSGLLTKKFINLIKQAEDGMLDLNKAADTLEVTVSLFGQTIRSYNSISWRFYVSAGAKEEDIWHNQCPWRNWSHRKENQE